MDFILLLAHPMTHIRTAAEPEARRPSCAGPYGVVAVVAVAVAALAVVAVAVSALAVAAPSA